MSAIRGGLPWTPEETEDLIRWWSAGLSAHAIGLALSRSEVAVFTRMRILRGKGVPLVPPRRDDGMCPNCESRPRTVRPDGRLRGWCRPCESAQKTQYQRTDAGKATLARYHRSQKGRAATKRAYERHKARQKEAGT